MTCRVSSVPDVLFEVLAWFPPVLRTEEFHGRFADCLRQGDCRIVMPVSEQRDDSADTGENSVRGTIPCGFTFRYRSTREQRLLEFLPDPILGDHSLHDFLRIPYSHCLTGPTEAVKYISRSHFSASKAIRLTSGSSLARARCNRQSSEREWGGGRGQALDRGVLSLGRDG